MKIALDRDSAQALRQLADTLPKAVSDITEATVQLMTVWQSCSDSVGPHAESFQSMLEHIRKAQLQASETLQTLPAGMRTAADRIEQYLASRTVSEEVTLTGKSEGADGEAHEYNTLIRFSPKADELPTPAGFSCSQEQAHEWGNQYYSGWISSLSQSEQAALTAYSGAEYGELNRKLRAGFPLTQRESFLKENIHSALTKASLPEDVLIYRALPENAVRELALYCSEGIIEEGIFLQDPAFMSCSLVSDNRFNRTPANQYIFRLSAPAGVHAAYIGGLSLFEEEQELLTDGDHSIYVTGVTKCLRSEITNRPDDNDEITVIDGVLTV